MKFEDKNGDGRIQYYNEGGLSDAASYGWQGNEMVTVNRDIMVMANPEIAGLPDWVIALVAAGGIAAALSTAAGLLLVISTSVSHDLLKSTFARGISDKQELLAGRIAAAVAISIAGYLGLHPPAFVAQVVAFAFGLAAASLFPAILMGIFNKRMNKWGAICGMLADRRVNIVDLSTRSRPGPGGSPHYEMVISAEVPDDVESTDLRQALEIEANRLVIDVSLTAI